MRSRDRHLEWLAAALVHEVRNPLCAIRSAAQYLQGRPADERSLRFLGIITHEADRLARLSADFLAYAAPWRASLAAADLPSLLEAAWTVVAPAARKNGVTAVACLAAHVPPARGHADSLQQALVNVLQNATEAMPQGGRITITAGLAGDSVRLVVADQGIGLPPGQAGRLFAPFATTKPGGNGLGLAIVKRIIEHHRGRVFLTGRPGRGATVTLLIPAVPPVTAPPPAAPVWQHYS